MDAGSNNVVEQIDCLGVGDLLLERVAGNNPDQAFYTETHVSLGTPPHLTDWAFDTFDWQE